MKQRVCVGMSGGVDSSVTACLLQSAGYEVVGVTFINRPWDHQVEKAVADARSVADQIGIAHHVMEEKEAFQREVVEYFITEYRQGRTPNPCVICNERIKFGSLLTQARSLGAAWLATGHYARIESAEGRYQLRKGVDTSKDQSYFLVRLRQEQMAHILMPLGTLTKAQVRAMAREKKLKNHDQAESQEICFVPDNDYGRFLREQARLADHPGAIVTQDGTVLGQHNGVQYFTIGQREGLRLGGQKRPLYVVALEANSNRVVVGPRETLMRDEFDVTDCHWLVPEWKGGVTVKIRYHHQGCPATVERLTEGRVRVRTAEPQRAVTPGQAAVFYSDDLVLGGGWID